MTDLVGGGGPLFVGGLGPGLPACPLNPALMLVLRLPETLQSPSNDRDGKLNIPTPH